MEKSPLRGGNGFCRVTDPTAHERWPESMRRKPVKRVRRKAPLKSDLPAIVAASDRLRAECLEIQRRHWGKTGRYWCNWTDHDSKPKARKPKAPEPAPVAQPASPVIAFTDAIAFRMSGRELREIVGNGAAPPEAKEIARAELERRRVKRAEKRVAA